MRKTLLENVRDPIKGKRVQHWYPLYSVRFLNYCLNMICRRAQCSLLQASSWEKCGEEVLKKSKSQSVFYFLYSCLLALSSAGLLQLESFYCSYPASFCLCTQKCFNSLGKKSKYVLATIEQ